MSKKHKKNIEKKPDTAKPEDQESEKKKSYKIVFVGAAIVITGFFVLVQVNSMADNWAGFTAPVMLLAGWITIAAGLWRSGE